MKTRVRSFDVFDTLVARRCIEPVQVLSVVSQRSGLKDFVAQRLDAERQISDKMYTLDMIYDQLFNVYGYSRRHCQYVKNLELAAEWNSFIPIVQNCQLVEPQDLLISDMYLPLEFVRQIVREICGLKFNQLYLTSSGKWTGRAWTSTLKTFDITLHMGDNLRTDIETPSQNNVMSLHYTGAKPTSFEAHLIDSGFETVALLCREARLLQYNGHSAHHNYSIVQTQQNFAFILFSAFLLLRCAEKNNWDKLLFSSRDCYLFHQICKTLVAVMGFNITCEYFFTSRLSRAAPSVSYLSYFAENVAGGRCAVVDICGTGWSLARLFDAHPSSPVAMFLVHKITNPIWRKEYEERFGKASASHSIEYLVDGGDSVALEAFNLADHDLVSDVSDIDGFFFPIYEALPGSALTREYARVAAGSINTCDELLKKIPRETLFRIYQSLTTDDLAAVYRSLSDNRSIVEQIIEQQVSESSPAQEILQARLALHQKL